MISHTIDEYAKQCELERQEQDNLPSFKIFTYESKAYLLPLNTKANYFASGHFNDYRNFQPIPLSAADINMITDGLKAGQLKVIKEDLT